MRITRRDVLNVINRFEWFRDPAKQGYLATALDRFVHTLNLVPELVNPSGVRVLEIGGIPYFQTILVRELFGYDVAVINEPLWERGIEGNHDVLVDDAGVVHDISFRTADIEYERWPYDDETFDIVLYCEVIEHLVYDPTHTLVEAHRVLKRDTGKLLISTPNALSYTALVQMVAGRNFYPPYSGYNYHARHHRLFSPDELAYLVREVGYDVHTCYSTYDRGYPHPAGVTPLVWLLRAMGRLKRRLDVIYLLATPVGEPRYAYPSRPPHLIYLDVHGYARWDTGVVSMARGTPQLLDGFYPLEEWGEGVRWTRDRARLYLRYQGESTLTANVFTGSRRDGEHVRMSLAVTDESLSFEHRQPFSLPPSTWQTVALSLPTGLPQKLIAIIDVENTFVPRELDPESSDDRRLGVAVRDVALT